MPACNEALDEFDSANPRLCSRHSTLGEAYDALCSHKVQCSEGKLSTPETIDNAARAIKEELARLQPLVTQRYILADVAFRERHGLKPRE